MPSNSEWHEDQALSAKNRAERKAIEEAERSEILNTYKWVKVPRYYEVDPNNEDVNWKDEYQKLMKHHKEETEFLINKVRELVK